MFVCEYVCAHARMYVCIFFVDVFLTHKHSIKLCTKTSIISLYVSEVIFAPLAGLKMRVTQISESRWCLRVVAGHEI